MNELVEQYLEIWNTTDPKARRAAIDAVWAEGGRYVDPLAEVQGRDQFDATVAAVQAQFPGFAFRLAGPVDSHHDQARFSWELGQPEAEALVVGFDVALRNSEGQISSVLGFLDRVPG